MTCTAYALCSSLPVTVSPRHHKSLIVKLPPCAITLGELPVLDSFAAFAAYVKECGAERIVLLCPMLLPSERPVGFTGFTLQHSWPYNGCPKGLKMCRIELNSG